MHIMDDLYIRLRKTTLLDRTQNEEALIQVYSLGVTIGIADVIFVQNTLYADTFGVTCSLFLSLRYIFLV